MMKSKKITSGTLPGFALPIFFFDPCFVRVSSGAPLPGLAPDPGHVRQILVPWCLGGSTPLTTPLTTPLMTQVCQSPYEG